VYEFYNNIISFKVMKRIAFLVASVLLLTACNNEVNNIDDVDGAQITLNMPDAKVFTYSTATESECVIDKLWVLEFNGNTLVNSQLIDGSNIFKNGQAMQLLPQLSFKPTNGNKIIFVANSDVTSLPVPTGVTPATINTGFPVTKPYYIEGEHLPMYGEIASWPSTYSCDMIREVAKVQVRLGETLANERNSYIQTLGYFVYNYGLAGLIQPVPLQVVSPSTQHSTTHAFTFLQSQYTPTSSYGGKTVYIHEYPNATKDVAGNTILIDTFAINRHFLLLSEAANKQQASYRLDFYDSRAKKFLDINRNCHYIFTINKINGDWYNYPQNAINNPGSNIEYEINVVEVGSSHITSNGQYAIVTSVDTAYVPAGVTNYPAFMAKIQLPTEMTALGAGTYISQLVVGLTTVSPAALTTNYQTFNVTTAPAFTSGYIRFDVGNIIHYVMVKKQ
jgi:hypothetical protein